MKFVAAADGTFDFGARKARCALGRAGVLPAREKREGDGASPAGVWPIRRVLYRPDKGRPQTALPIQPIARDDIWCDDPSDPARYNRPAKLPYSGSFEKLWRDDDLYDVVVVLGHNDAPVVPHMGSCIFVHRARPGYEPTQGCVALAWADLTAFLAAAKPGDTVEIRA